VILSRVWGSEMTTAKLSHEETNIRAIVLIYLFICPLFERHLIQMTL